MELVVERCVLLGVTVTKSPRPGESRPGNSASHAIHETLSRRCRKPAQLPPLYRKSLATLALPSSGRESPLPISPKVAAARRDTSASCHLMRSLALPAGYGSDEYSPARTHPPARNTRSFASLSKYQTGILNTKSCESDAIDHTTVARRQEQSGVCALSSHRWVLRSITGKQRPRNDFQIRVPQNKNNKVMSHVA